MRKKEEKKQIFKRHPLPPPGHQQQPGGLLQQPPHVQAEPPSVCGLAEGGQAEVKGHQR